jgi:hypothetical protein
MKFSKRFTGFEKNTPRLSTTIDLLQKSVGEAQFIVVKTGN